MRLWSISPEYLDSSGLVACWRESLLAKKVLEGKTKGYKNHPQLIRFKQSKFPIYYINLYLYYIWEEAQSRNYSFNEQKIDHYMITINPEKPRLLVKSGQIKYEFTHLLKKLKSREIEKYYLLKDTDHINCNKLFSIVSDDTIEYWEKTF